MQLSFLQTLILAFPILYLGRVMVQQIPFLHNYNIPSAVVGGFTAALMISLLLYGGMPDVTFEPEVRNMLMLAFFTTVGLGASYRLLLYGGVRVFLFLFVATGLLLVQNGVGVGVATALDQHYTIGLVGGTITLSGGHGTGLAWSEIFENQYQIPGLLEIALAAATFGLIAGGLLGGPVAERLIRRHNLKPDVKDSAQKPALEEQAAFFASETQAPRPGIDGFLIHIFVILICVAIALYVTSVVETGIPTFVWAIFSGIIIRNLLDIFSPKTSLIEASILDIIARVALSLFLAAAIMSVKINELIHLAAPMLIILVSQVVAMACYAYFITFRVMGGNYDAAVIAGGHCGFGLGATPTAVANMAALSGRYGASPQAFLVVPLVGAFFIDIANAIVIHSFLSIFGS